MRISRISEMPREGLANSVIPRMSKMILKTSVFHTLSMFVMSVMKC